MKEAILVEETCKDCKGIGSIKDLTPTVKACFKCSACKGEGVITIYMCGYHPKEEIKSPTAMCWVCISEDDDYRKHRRRVHGNG